MERERLNTVRSFAKMQNSWAKGLDNPCFQWYNENMNGRNGVARKNREKREMNMVYCNVCGVEYNSLRVVHKCDPVELKRIFREEELHPEDCNLNGDDLKDIRQAIVDNGSPADLVAMWEKSAERQWQA